MKCNNTIINPFVISRQTVKIATEFGKGEGKIIHHDLLEHDRINSHTSYISGLFLIFLIILESDNII